MAQRLMLAFVLGLLAVLAGFVTVNAYVAVKIESSLADFDSGTFIYTGLLDIPPDIHSVQLLPVGLTGDWQVSDRPLPEKRADMAAAANGNVLYVIGGTDDDGDVRATVYSSIISDVYGALTPWQTDKSLPAPRTGAGSAVFTGTGDISTLYVVGGLQPGWTATDTIFRAQVDNATGQIQGDWTTDARQVPVPLYYAEVVQHSIGSEHYLYVIGGTNGAESYDSVYFAPIDPDGSLGSFATTSPLPERLFDGYAVVYNGVETDTVYYVGGAYITGTFDTRATYEVYFADFLPSGELSSWQRSEGALPRNLYAHSGSLINRGEIMLAGGIDDPLNPTNSFTSTVKAALVDPENPSFRLYDWCEGIKPPTCTIGAWQTGALLPDVRALHGTAYGRGHVYVLGGEDGVQNIVDTVFFGSVNGVGALYSPEGVYRSNRIDLGQPAKLKELTWETTIGHPGEMGLTMKYQTSADGTDWLDWTPEEPSQDGTNWIVPVDPPTDTRYIRYQVKFTTAVTNASPLLDEVRIYYEVPDPDVAVVKDTGDVVTVALGSTLLYTINYTNTGGWVAESVVLTETLPDNTTYVEGQDWNQVGASRTYTQRVGDVERASHGNSTFKVRVNDEVPANTYRITNQIEINYPPMIDAFGETITDTKMDDNLYRFSNPLSFYTMTITKDADPPSGETVSPGDRITYTIRYTNTGTRQASQTVLTDTFDPFDSYLILTPSLPAGTEYYTWDLGLVRPSDGGGETIIVQLQDELPNKWPITNQASLYSPEGDPFHAPMVIHHVKNMSGTEPAPMVDLTVQDLRWTPEEPLATEPVEFCVTIVNSGTLDADEYFFAELYIKADPSDPPEWPSDHDQGYCLNGCAITRPDYIWYGPVGGLPAGSSGDVCFAGEDVIFPDAEVAYDIYVQIDVADENPYWGRYAEADEGNNLTASSYTTPVDPGPDEPRMYLPAIYKNAP
jgi:uncharacterized repeat protein (TIGR01451 family)